MCTCICICMWMYAYIYIYIYMYIHMCIDVRDTMLLSAKDHSYVLCNTHVFDHNILYYTRRPAILSSTAAWGWKA